MPSHYTHMVFGRLVLAALPDAPRALLWSHRAAYNIGLQGPDVLFYYHPLTKNPVRREGSEIHACPGSSFFRRCAGVLRRCGTPERRSYVAGCLCHYYLDSAFHPAIDASPAGHSAVEAELDRLLMHADGVDPFSREALAHLPSFSNARELAEILAPFYPLAGEKVLEQSLRAMGRTAGLLRLRSPVKRAAVTGALRAMGKYEAYGGMFLLPWSDRSCAPLCRELAKKLPETAREAVRQMEKLFPALDTGAPFDPRLKLTFGGVELD